MWLCSPDSPRSHLHWPTQPHGAPAASGKQQLPDGGDSPPDGGSGHATPGHHSRSGTPDLPSGSGGGGAPSAAYMSLPAPPRSPFAAQMGQRQTEGDTGRALLSQLSFPRLAAGASRDLAAATPLPFMRRGRHAAAAAAVAEHPNIIGRIDSADGSSVHGPPCGAGFVYPDAAAPVGAAHFTGLPRHAAAPEADAFASADAVRIRLSRSMPRLNLAAGAAGLGAARCSVTGDRRGSADGIEVLPEAQVQSNF